MSQVQRAFTHDVVCCCVSKENEELNSIRWLLEMPSFSLVKEGQLVFSAFRLNEGKPVGRMPALPLTDFAVTLWAAVPRHPLLPAPRRFSAAIGTCAGTGQPDRARAFGVNVAVAAMDEEQVSCGQGG